MWYEYKTELPDYKEFKILKNDDNLKPDWVENPSKNTEFHIIKGSDNVLVVIGESWTYGESLPGIATGIDIYSLESQLKYSFAPLLSQRLNVDLYQYAVPGNCNFYMFSSIERIIKHLKENFNYKKIDLCVQITEPSREYAIVNKLTGPYREIYNMTNVKTFHEWLIRYDEIFLNELEKLKQEYDLNVVVWKNFCPFQNKKEYPTLTLVNETWIQFSGKLLGKDVGHQKFQSVGWFDDFYNHYKNVLKFDLTEISKELDKIESSNSFIRGNELHNNHPTAKNHNLWAKKLQDEYFK